MGVIGVSQNKYKEAVGYECAHLTKLQTEYSAMVKGISPAVRSTKKYSSEYL